ncbi:MAG: T9SS type B sorting domain-containing protein [Bacteroidales bacterium]|nr:T9SS type B sorting domain-containing protein [Bacteroidales bacterium]
MLYSEDSGNVFSAYDNSINSNELSFIESSSQAQNPVLPPVALCRSINVILGPSGTVTISGSDVDGGSYDPDGTIVSRSVNPSTFYCTQLGANTVTLSVTDSEGLSSTCTTTVMVSDRTAPVVQCKNATAYLDISGKASISVADINNGSSDNCTAGFYLFLSRSVFDCQDIGSPVQITLTGTDGSGNSSSCVAQVTVLDTIAPRIFVKPFDLVLDTAGTAILLPENIDNGSFDNCGSLTLSVSPDTFTCSDLGQKTVILAGTDPNGNTSTRPVVITVSSTLRIKSVSLNSCDLVPTLALFQADIEGGNEDYSYFWKGLDENRKPFMVINTWPPSVHFYNTSTLATPYLNNNLPNNLYDIRLVITDGHGCVDTADITINKTDPVYNNETYRKSEACEGETRNYFVNYKPDATYSWSVVNGTILTADQDTSMISVRWDLGVPDGTVTATIIMENDEFPGEECEATVTDNVTIIPVPVPAFVSPDINVCSDSEITYTLADTYSNYLWAVTGGVVTGGGTESDNYVTVLWGSGPAGTIMVSAGNQLSCSGSVMINVSVSGLTGTITGLTNVTCNGLSDGTVTVEATSGTGVSPYEYSLDGEAWQSSGSFSSVSAGNHNIAIRDAASCTYVIPFIITQPSPVYGTLSGITDVSCLGGSNGSAAITATGGVAPYQYSLNGGAFQGSNTFVNLSAGLYTVTIRDNSGCEGTLSFTITQPLAALAGTISITDVSCFGGSTGEVNLEVSGGVPPYTYLWNNGQTTQDIKNLAAGDYSVLITDFRNCTLTVSATVAQPGSAVSASGSVLNVACFGESTGSIDLSPAGGVPPYTYLWSNGSTTQDISDLAAGTYSVTITDFNGCTANYSTAISQPVSPLGGAVSSQTNVSCRGGDDGTLTVTGTGGTLPYEYSLDGLAYQSSGAFTGLDAGGHTVTVRDGNLCEYNLAVTITEPDASLEGNVVSQVDVGCFGGNSGNVTVAGTGGTSPYNYAIDGGTFQTSGVFGNLSAGTHTITIRDFRLCLYDLVVTINQPAQPLSVSLTKTDVICRGDLTGSATAVAAGGTSPYSYTWNTTPVQTGSTASGLRAGTYTVTVVDDNGCQTSSDITISEPATSLTLISEVTNADCFGNATGAIDLTVSNGAEPVSYVWSTGATDQDLAGIPAGTYNVVATDLNGCIESSSITVEQPELLAASIEVTNVSCFGGNNGSANLTVTGGTSPYIFLWDGGQTTEDTGNLVPGTYSVTITDSNGCEITANCVVTEPATALGGTVTGQSDVTVYGGSDGSITVAGSGGTPPYDYRINAGAWQSSGTFGSLVAGTHTLTVRDAGLCTFEITVTISQPSVPLSANVLDQKDALCYAEESGSISITGWGGSSPYEYSIDGSNYQQTGDFIYLGAGSYTITVRDALMATYELPFVISQPDPITLTFEKTDVRCRNEASGTATVIVTGGTEPFVYAWNTDPVQTSATASGLTAGTYTVSVTDANGCNAVGSVVIIQPNDDLLVTLTVSDVLCSGGASGRATANVFGGTGPYSYQWDTAPVQNSFEATGLVAGNYTVTVTDINGCTTSGTVEINEPDPITVDYSVNIATCPDSEDGGITITVQGGTGPYYFLWSDGVVTQNRSNIKPGNYTVIVTDQNACSKSLETEVIFTGSFACVEIPNIITPNNDGYNDTWVLKNITLYPDAEILVFNRWGKLVFRTKNIADNPWDGRSDGKPVPADSYHYILYLNDGSEPKSGVISVIR